MANLLSTSLLKSGPTLGDVSASSLVKSAATLDNELNTYNDAIQKYNFDTNPTTANLNTYTSYLQGRINELTSPGTSLADQTKAITMQDDINSAITTNTTFNIDSISSQIMAGNASDQDKLNYLQGVLSNPAVQADPDMYEKYQNQAYSLQQSIEYEAQAQQTANETQYTADETATKAGYTNAIDALESGYKTITATFKDGGVNETNTAMQNFVKQHASTFQALGVKLPEGAQLTMASLAQAVLNGEYAYYENGAVALGSMADPYGGQNPDVQTFLQKASDIKNGITTLSTPAGDKNIFEINQWRQEASNMYTPKTDANGQTTLSQNAISGYEVKNGQVIPQTRGSATSTFDALSSLDQKNLRTQLTNLGFTITGTSGGNLQVQLTNKTAKWMGLKTTDLIPGDTVTLISTNGGKGFQLLSNSGKVYGLSFDDTGKAALYGANQNGQYSMISGQYGFNPKASITAPSAKTNPVLAQNVSGIANSYLQPSTKGPQMVQRAGGGFNFTNAQGKSISAATYAQLTGQQFRTVLQTMANRGDTGAKSALSFVGNDYGYNPNAIGNNGNLYNSLVWGTGKSFTGATPSVSLPSGIKL